MDNKHDSPLTTPPLTAQANIDITKPPFNAAGDGVTDDSRAFQDGVNAAGNSTLCFASEHEGESASEDV